MYLYYINVTIHVFAAIFWLGGMFFLAAVGAPALRQVEPRLRSQLFRELGVRFKWWGWAAVSILILTGIGNLHFRGLLHAEVWTSRAFWFSLYGHTLLCKLVTVTIMVTISAVHDFYLGPAASAAEPGSPRAQKLRRWAALAARTNAIVAIFLVIAAVLLARGV